MPPFAALDRDELARRRQHADRLLMAEGASHVVHGDVLGGEAGPPRHPTWQIDPVPLEVDPGEWDTLAAGLTQRARLLEAVLDDLYGAQELFAAGLLPPEAVVGYRGFVHAMAGPDAPRPRRRLLVYGADVVRAADGRFVVVRDRTDVPSGLGYALVTRKVLARLSGEDFRADQVQPLQPFFRGLRAALAEHAPADRLSPRVVILTPGYPHRHYFEHSYLAAQLGYHLAEGADLTVRGGRVWLRALGGLEPVDVVLRCIDDLTADSLEGEGPALAAGVPGLIQASREGRVGLANAMGTGAVETLALAPYLAALCRHLLHEALLLPSAATYWCGDPGQAATVVDRLDQLVLHGLVPGALSVDGRGLDDDHLGQWRAAIAAAPYRVAAREPLGGHDEPAGAVVLRLLAAATGPGGWEVLPGGVARMVGSGEPVLDQPQGPTKDVWVGARPGGLLNPWRRSRADLPQVDLQASLPTWVAEALFWVGRNAERAEQTARLTRAVLLRWEEVPALVELGGPEWRAAALAGLRAGSGGRGIIALGADADIELGPAVDAALSGRRGSLTDSLAHLLGATATVREYLSGGTWRLLGLLGDERSELLAGAGALGTGDLPGLAEVLDRTVVSLMALAGLEDESMSRGPGWRFLELGRRIERGTLLAGQVEAVLGREVDEPVATALAELVLDAHESLVVYRRRFRSDIELDQVLELLLADESNPRSLTFSVDRVREHLAALPWRDGAEADKHLTLVDDVARALIERDGLDLGAMVNGRRTDVDRLVVTTRGPLLELAGRLVETWFADRAGVPSRRWEL